MENQAIQQLLRTREESAKGLGTTGLVETTEPTEVMRKGVKKEMLELPWNQQPEIQEKQEQFVKIVSDDSFQEEIEIVTNIPHSLKRKNSVTEVSTKIPKITRKSGDSFTSDYVTEDDDSCSIVEVIVASKSDESDLEVSDAGGSGNVVPEVTDENILRRLEQLYQQIDNNCASTSKSLEEDFQKTCDVLMKKKNFLLEEISAKTEKFKSCIEITAARLKDPLKSNFLDHLEACFRSGQWLSKSIQPRRPECNGILADYVEIRYVGLEKVKYCSDQFLHKYPDANGPFLVNVVSITDPGEFYVIRVSDHFLRDEISSQLEEDASAYAIPLTNDLGQFYAVRDGNLKWHRGVCGSECGTLQITGKFSETLYDFFLLDQGRYEKITSSSVRILPPKLRNHPPLAFKCTLNHHLQPTAWSDKDTHYFKEIIHRGPLLLKINNQFTREGEALNVDLAQLPLFAENASHIDSVRDVLFYAHTLMSKSLIRKLKPKFISAPQQEQFNVRVSYARNPTNIYVQILDDQLVTFQSMEQELQVELQDGSDSVTQLMQKGLVCAVNFKDRWWRALVEDVMYNNRVAIFFVDTGHRAIVNHMDCVKLPERFMDLPAQALRCVLNGASPLVNGRQIHSGFRSTGWTHEVIIRILSCHEKQGTMKVERWIVGEVGRLETNELTANIVLHVHGCHRSVNSYLNSSDMPSTSTAT